MYLLCNNGKHKGNLELDALAEGDEGGSFSSPKYKWFRM